jgi:hypothetical protein
VGNVPPKLIQPRNGAKENSRSFCRPIRGLKLPRASQPTVAPWATFCRASGAKLMDSLCRHIPKSTSVSCS